MTLPDPPDPLIQLRDACRRDPSSDRWLLDHVSVQITSGDKIGLVGPSGSGKSTLLRSIVMLDPLDQGTVQYRGVDIGGDQVPGFRRQVVYLPQRVSLLAGTVRFNLQLPFRFRSSTFDYDESRVADLLSQIGGSAEMLDQSADSLSGGESQMVAMLRAILLQPKVLLLDEPTTGLDPAATQQVEQFVTQWHLGQLHAGGAGPTDARAYVWTSHDESQVQRMTSRMVSMRGGKVKETAT